MYIKYAYTLSQGFLAVKRHQGSRKGEGPCMTVSDEALVKRWWRLTAGELAVKDSEHRCAVSN